MYFDKINLSTEFWLEWLLLLFKLFINNDIRAFGLSQHVPISVTEVSDVDAHFNKVVLMLILYQQHSPTDYLLLLLTVDHIDIAGLSHHQPRIQVEVEKDIVCSGNEIEPSCERIVIIWMIIELTFLIQHTGSRICYLSLRKRHFGFF